LAGLLVVLMQTGGSPHSDVLVGQVQTPAVQVRPPVQAMPQPPQFWLSVFGSTQAPAHGVSVDAQVVPQAFCEQTWPVAHAVVQAPQ
jgi:hypothetical protein